MFMGLILRAGHLAHQTVFLDDLALHFLHQVAVLDDTLRGLMRISISSPNAVLRTALLNRTSLAFGNAALRQQPTVYHRSLPAARGGIDERDANGAGVVGPDASGPTPSDPTGPGPDSAGTSQGLSEPPLGGQGVEWAGHGCMRTVWSRGAAGRTLLLELRSFDKAVGGANDRRALNGGGPAG
jgi:hypothetical protein